MIPTPEERMVLWRIVIAIVALQGRGPFPGDEETLVWVNNCREIGMHGGAA